MATKHLKTAQDHEKIEYVMEVWALCLIMAAPWLYRITDSVLNGDFLIALGWSIGAFIAIVFALTLEGMYVFVFVWSSTLFITLPESLAKTIYYSFFFRPHLLAAQWKNKKAQTANKHCKAIKLSLPIWFITSEAHADRLPADGSSHA